jgi:hypothetical protein
MVAHGHAGRETGCLQLIFKTDGDARRRAGGETEMTLALRHLLAVAVAASLSIQWAVAQDAPVTAGRLDALAADIQRAEDVSAIKRLQRAYGYYLDKGMWEDLGDLFAEDAVANYPAGVYIGKTSIRRHLYMNVGGGLSRHTGPPEPYRNSFGKGARSSEPGRQRRYRPRRHAGASAT